MPDNTRPGPSLWTPNWSPPPGLRVPDPEMLEGRWGERNWRNTPGPFYGAATDTCGTGPIVGPANVDQDPDGQEFVIIQPRNESEFHAVVTAAEHDPFGGYGCNGNERWTVPLVRVWWRRSAEIRANLAVAIAERRSRPNRDVEYDLVLNSFLDFFDKDAAGYARRYMFWLEHRRPVANGEPLSEL